MSMLEIIRGYWKAVTSSCRRSRNRAGASAGTVGIPAAAEVTAPADPLPRAGGVTVGEIVGWRIWLVANLSFLTSLHQSGPWAPGEPMTADHIPDYSHQGVYAWKRKRDAISYMLSYAPNKMVFCGRVAMWGNVVEHEHGYRAENAKIISLDYASTIINESVDYPRNRERLAEFRKRYGLPEDDAEANAFAEKFASPNLVERKHAP